MENWNQKAGSCFTRDEEFNEEDIWSATETGDYCKSSVFSSSSSLSSRRVHSSPMKISEAKCEANLVQRSSAPVNVPDWSKIYGKNREIGSWVDDHNGNESHKVQDFDDDDDDDGESDDDAMIPPHEWIAKKFAGTQISSSVYEGIGRTLKGRDLSKLRNAILTKTGFLE